MVDTIKFSQMTNAGNINNNDVMPTLRSGANVLVNNPWTFLASGTTAQRPAPSAAINYRLRFNTDIQFYEYYDAVLLAWVQLADAGFIPSALTATPDTNVTITLGGTPATALLQPASITLGWTGTLAPSRGGLGTSSVPADGQVPVGSGGVYAPTSIGSGTGIVVGLGPASISVALAPVSTLNLLANLTGGSAAPTPHTLSAIIDACIGSTQGDILYRDAATWSVLSPGTSGFFLQTQGAAANPQWATAPGFVNSGTAGQLAYYATTGTTISGLTKQNNSVLVTNGTGDPSLSTTLPSGLTIPSPVINQIVGTHGFPVATFADVASTTDYFSFVSGTANDSLMQLVAGATNGSFRILAKGTGGVVIGATGATQIPMAWSNSTNSYLVQILNWTSDRYLNLPDADVTLVGGTMLSTALTSAHIFVGNGSNVATDVAMSGDATLANTGAITVASIGGKAVTLGGAFTMSGAFTFTGTLTADTAVTFPPSGTLATTAATVGTLSGDTGVATASAGNINVTGSTTGLTFTGATDTLTLGGVLALSHGGTNANLTAANGAIPYSTASAFALLAPGASGQLLQSGGAGAPNWTTATFASTYAVSTILYASSTNTVSGLATANSSVLITSAGGVPSLSTTLPSGIAATNMALTTPTIKGSNGFNVATFADVASATDYFSFSAGIANGAIVQLVSGGTNASFKMLAKGTGGVTIGSAAATTNPMTWTNSTNTFAVSIPAWTGNRTLTLPDADVTLTSGTMLSNTLTSAHIFVGNGSNVATDVAMSGDATLANTGALTIANNAVTTSKINNSAVTYAKIQNVAANSVIGNATSSSAVGTDVLISSIKSANSNLIIGGEFGSNPWQRGTSFTTPTGYTADRWFFTKAGGFTYSVIQDSNTPSVAVAGVKTTASYHIGFSNTVSPGSGDVLGLCQFIEGYRFSTIAQKTFTISFSVYASMTGTYCVAFINSGQDRSYVAEYTVNAANTWEYKTITVTASPSAGTWNYTTGVGLEVFFTMASGTDYQTTANAWQTGFFVATSNQVAATTSGGTFYLDCVKVEDGATATPYQIEPMSQILNDCYRYYYTTYSAGVVPGTVTTNGTEYTVLSLNTFNGLFIKSSNFQQSQRTAGTITIYSPGTGASGNYYDFRTGADFACTADFITTKGFIMRASGVAVTPMPGYQYTADAEL